MGRHSALVHDPGSESVGRVAADGTVTEYALPELPTAAQGYESDPYPTPGAITTTGGIGDERSAPRPQGPGR
jgi:hypothetical protein